MIYEIALARQQKERHVCEGQDRGVTVAIGALVLTANWTTAQHQADRNSRSGHHLQWEIFTSTQAESDISELSRSWFSTKPLIWNTALAAAVIVTIIALILCISSGLAASQYVSPGNVPAKITSAVQQLRFAVASSTRTLNG